MVISTLLRYSPVQCHPFIFFKKDEEDDDGGGEGEMEEQAKMVGSAFVQHYYNLFDTERASLIGLYQPNSMLTFEGQRFLGVEEISSKLITLPFESCQHEITTIDCQPSFFNAGILVFVSGRLQLAGEEHQLRFSQMFHLVPTAEGSFYVQNDIFRLNYG